MAKFDYRKLWEQHYGPIPVDSQGRTYEIHHIDGNRDNNNINNLICISIEEHYKIHLAQNDFAAAALIALRMEIDPFERNRLHSKYMKMLTENGKNPFSMREDGSSIGKEVAQRRVLDGTHNFFVLAKERVIKGTNPFQSQNRKGPMGNEFAKGANKGTIPCLDKEGNFIRVEKHLYDEMKKITNPTERLYVHIASDEGSKRKQINIGE